TCNRPSPRFNCRKIDGRPVALLCRRVRIGRPRNLGNSDYTFVVAAMIEQDCIAGSHLAKTISRREIANAGPASLAIGKKIRPRIGGRLLLHQPEVFHDFKLTTSRETSRVTFK